jgi:adenylate kinase
LRIVLMGPPGAGKGTQAKKLVEKFGMRHLSSGDILRAERASGSSLGKKLAEYMDVGKLVPDKVVVDVMAAALSGDEAGGLLLDGFPRTVQQAEALDRQLAKAGRNLDAVVVMDADEAMIVRRIAGRRSCPKCGKAYHVEFMPPRRDMACDDCGAALVQRPDDNEAVVRQRLEAYRKQTEPVIAYYRRQAGLKMIEVDGGGQADAVFAELAAKLQALGAGN